MKTINTKDIFTKYIDNFKKGREESWNYSYNIIIAFNNGMKRIEKIYHRSFGDGIISLEQFKKNIYDLQECFYKNKKPFDYENLIENEIFFKDNSLGIIEIYAEMKENDLDFDLKTDWSPVYYNLNFHLQNYCFDFITKDFE